MGDREYTVPNFPLVVRPTGVHDYYPLIYRAFVASLDDPKMLQRVQVRVIGIHTENLNPEYLPWAEIAFQASSPLAGDLFPFQVGDGVWVMFEGGDRRFPVVTGCWIGRPAGLSDVPNHVTVDYPNTYRRWLRVDRVGNTLEMSEAPTEEWLRLASGSAQIRLSQQDGSITLQCASGALSEEATNIDLSADAYVLTADTVIISAESKQVLGAVGLLKLMANMEANLHALNPVTGEGVVRLGGYLPTIDGVATPDSPGSQFRQTPLLEVRAREAVLGTPSGDTLSGGLVPETATLSINGQSVSINAAAAVNLPSGATIQIVVNAAGNISITSTTKVTISAPEIDLTSGTSINMT